MASLTVRQLDEKVKKLLRLRAARHGRSMEDEIRTILGQAANAAGREVLEAFDPPNRPRMSAAAVQQPASKLPADRTPPGPASDERAAVTARRVLLIIGGGIAAYKSLDLIRRLQDHGIAVRCVLTKAAQEFVTPLAAGALAGGHVFTDLFDPKSEFDVGHIRLARDTDLVVVAPATADLMAKMAGGHADDLASAVLLATDKPILIAPAMNPMMWSHKATQRNLAQLVDDGVLVVGPNAGEMAERGEAGTGRMAEPTEIADAAMMLLNATAGERPLAGKRIVITSGPTHEPIDPVRYIANRSSGKQGHAIAAAAAAAGADVVLVSGPVNVPDPVGVRIIKVEIGAADARCGRPRRCRRIARSSPRRSPTGAWPMPRWRRSRKQKLECLHCRWSRTPTSLRQSRIANRHGRDWWLVLPPRPKISSPMRKTSSSAKDATGLSPMMCH